MIKIIGQDASITKRVTCRNCGAILEYTPNDVKEKTTRDISGSADTEFYIECPQCSKHVCIRG